MKYKFICIIILIALFACKGFTDEKESDSNPNKCTQYACPIHTDKTSTSPDRCPVCNGYMSLISDSLKKDSLKWSK
jgi:hypothetical protein